LNLAAPDEKGKSKIVQTMEIEMHGWFARYPARPFGMVMEVVVDEG
jgi:hypothetical protein